MKSHALPLFGAAAAGFAIAVLCFTAWAPRPASAQFTSSQVGPGFSVAPQSGGGVAPQPIEVQALDADHFVVASREPRLVSQIGREGTAQNMLVTVVTHYTVQGDRLAPVEHARVPTGYRLVTVED
jgi:hypothetical protein